ncbi:hypothetical protein P886_1454 [Alteromonadaceae bacterium 2753L.S.0a.02]|nr:hypothetical protein P886_1454 [Alteromonadaceae bacterium 2753L.S.0a.02]
MKNGTSKINSNLQKRVYSVINRGAEKYLNTRNGINLKLILKAVLFASVSIANFVNASTQDYPIQPSAPTVVDEFNVNLASMMPEHHVNTVSIGNLNHSISVYSSNFNPVGYYAYLDKYAGVVRYRSLGEASFKGQNYQNLAAMKASGPLGSEDFVVKVNGILQGYVGSNVTSGYSYVAVGDERNTLDVVPQSGGGDAGEFGGYLRWTQPDGTKLFYLRSSQDTHSTSTGRLRVIIYPSGYRLDINHFGVVSNTGFQLKYDYVGQDSGTGLPADKQQIFNGLPPYSNVRIVELNPGMFWGRNPKYIVGINRAVDYCDSNDSISCTGLSVDWPKATFSWPQGMPRSFFLGESKVTVEDARGGITDFYYEAQDLSVVDEALDDNYSTHPWKRREGWVPRLVAVKTSESDVVNYTYEYKNWYRSWFNQTTVGLGPTAAGADPSTPETGESTEEYEDPEAQGWDRGTMTLEEQRYELLGEMGLLKNATGPAGKAHYQMQQLCQSGQGRCNVGSGDSDIAVALSPNMPNRLVYVSLHGRHVVTYSGGFDAWRNYPALYHPFGDRPQLNMQTDGYDSRNNITRFSATSTAGYPSSCSNRKTCNKPTWVRDGNGKQTDYTYHPESGQVATVTLPADKHGKRAQTRYYYEQKYAYYKKDSNTVERADSPIWLLVREEYCNNSAASGQDCAGNDEVVTTYDYGPENQANNLLLRGVKVAADSKQRITCFQYDIYGNKIGETKPKGVAGSDLSSCY